MGAQDNAALIRRGYEAYAVGDMDAIREIFAPDIAWHIGGRSPVSGEYKGVDQVFGFFGQLVERSGGTFAIDVHDLLASDDHVVVLTHETGSRSGRTLSIRGSHVWHLAGGKATEFWALPDDQYAEDEFWAD